MIELVGPFGIKTEAMHDETILLMEEHEAAQCGQPQDCNEIVNAYKADKAWREASKLVSDMLKEIEKGKVQSYWGYHKRISQAERVAIRTAKLLGDLARNKNDARLHAHYARVRISIRERTYCNYQANSR